MQLLLYRGEVFDANFYYQSGIDIDHSFFLLQDNRKTLFVSKMNEAIARKSFRGKVVVYGNALDSIKSHLKEKTVFVDDFSLGMRLAGKLKKFCSLKDFGEELKAARMVKKPNEVASIRKAAKHTREIIASLDFRKAKTELDLKKQILVAIAESGLEPSFDPIVATDGNTAYPHYSSGKKKIGSLVLVDCGVKFNHYCSDLSRCFILDNDKRKKQQYEDLQAVCHAIADELPSLEDGRDIAEFADFFMKKSGFPKMIHSVGHGLGLEIHELPSLNPKSKDKIAGCTMAIEPAFYLKSYGMRFEETVYFNGTKTRIL